MPAPNESSLIWLVLTSISTSALSLVAVAFLIRSILNHWLSKDIETYRMNLNKDTEAFKSSLQRENDREIERLRAELKKLELEHQVRFSKLHETVFETIAELYKRIVQAHDAMWNYLKPMVWAGEAKEDVRAESARKAWHELRTYSIEHEIYFNEKTCVLVHQYVGELRELFTKFANKDYDKRRTETWESAFNGLNTKAAEIKKALEGTFRKEIGIE